MTEKTVEAAEIANVSRPVNTRMGKFGKKIRRNWPLLCFMLPAVVVTFLFCYLPIYGVLIAFQDFMPGDSILSDTTIWIGWSNFSRFFQDYQFWPLMRNTFLLCIIGFVVGFPLPIIVALMLNAMKSKKGSKVLQTIFNAPHFISLVVMVGMLYLFFGRYGLVNNIAEALGGERFSYFLSENSFRPMYILSSNWQDFGWSAIIYISALSGVDQELYEAARIDGCGRLRIFTSVIAPLLTPIASTVTILQSVTIFNDFTNPLYFLPGNDNVTIQLTLYNFMGKFASKYNLLFADIVLVTIPMLLLFLFFNKKIIEGMAAGAVKG